jgi:hypothetical protein
MKNPVQPRDSRRGSGCRQGSERRSRPTMRYFFKGSDEISTLKENAINNLRKEIKHSGNVFKFKSPKIGAIYQKEMTRILHVVYSQARIYDLEASTYCLFLKVFMTYVSKNLKEFMSGS